MTYAELQAQVTAWASRDDLAGPMPGFFAITEERINRALRTRDMELVLVDTPIIDNLITPAADVLDVKVLWAPGYPQTPLFPQSLESVIASTDHGTPTMYGWQGGSLYFDGGGSVQGVLYVKVPSLEANSTNWLSVKAPSLYLFGVLAEAKLYARDEAGAQIWGARFTQLLDELNGNDQRRSGPLVSRPR
jgi:hypothetical protein